MNQTVRSNLAKALVAHSLAFVERGDVFDVEDGALLFELETFIRESGPNSTSLVLQVTASSAQLGTTPVIECFAGWGLTEKEAGSQAFGKFLLGSFHVLVEALTSHSCAESQAEIEHWEGRGCEWTIFSGPLLSQFSTESLLTPAYGAFLSKIQEHFQSEVSPGPHWVRVFLGVHGGNVQAGEVLLDNETWGSAERDLFSFSWSCAEEYQSVRHFILALSREA